MQRLRNTGSAKEETENGIQEVFEVIAVAASYPVRLETEPTGLGVATVIFSKIDTYGAVWNRTGLRQEITELKN